MNVFSILETKSKQSPWRSGQNARWMDTLIFLINISLTDCFCCCFVVVAAGFFLGGGVWGVNIFNINIFRVFRKTYVLVHSKVLKRLR